jgi:hypothetical protein
MRVFIAILVAGGFLWSDAALALPERGPVAQDSIRETDEQQVARRRRKRKRRKKKKKPKVAPRPAPVPGEREVVPIGPGGRMRIEFMMGSNVFGQTTQPGEVRILERKDTQLKSMVKRRTGFQKEIIQTVFPDYPR